jgi:hypothetical protein
MIQDTDRAIQLIVQAEPTATIIIISNNWLKKQSLLM